MEFIRQLSVKLVVLLNGAKFKGLVPTAIVGSVFEIDYEALWKKGIRVLAFDIDNTLGLQHCVDLSEEVKALFAQLRARGFRLVLATNNGKKRDELVNELGCQLMQAKYSLFPRKPSRRYYRQLCQMMAVQPFEACMVGDKLFFDALGARRAGLEGILVTPLGEDLILDEWVFRPAENEYLRVHDLKHAG